MFINKKRLFILTLIFTVGVLPVKGYAWNYKALQLSASMAWSQLDEAKKPKLIELLKSHPRYEEDFITEMPGPIKKLGIDAQNAWLFQRAAIWPDEARAYQGSLKKQYYRAKWHFINQPVYLSPSDENALKNRLSVNLKRNVGDDDLVSDHNILQALRNNLKIINQADASNEDKAIALCWLIHLVADLHQPLHVSMLFSESYYKNGDQAGKAILITGQGSKNKNLHSLWDNIMGKPLSFNAIEKEAGVLQSKYPITEEQSINFDEWFEGTYKIAAESAYTWDIIDTLFAAEHGEAIQPLIIINDDYIENAKTVAEKQLVLTSVRLQQILENILN